MIAATARMTKQPLAVLAGGGIISLAAAFTLQSAGATPFGHLRALHAAAEQMSVVVPAGCYKWEFFGDLGFCQRHCAELPENFQRNHTYWTSNNCDSNIFPTNQESCKRARGTVMLKLTSCKASPGTGENTCIITVCGVTNALLTPKNDPAQRLKVEQPVPKPKVGPPGSSSSAIDRLGGGGTAGAPSGSGQSGGGSAPKASGGGAGASSTAPGAGSSTFDSRSINRTAPVFTPTPSPR
jgi:hypothetical protein